MSNFDNIIFGLIALGTIAMAAGQIYQGESQKRARAAAMQQGQSHNQASIKAGIYEGQR